MIEYKVQIDPQNGAVVIQGDFAPGSIAVNIPDANDKKKKYISYFLNKADIERGIGYLNCISLNNRQIVNESLFISGLAMFAKCFAKSKSRNELDKKEFKSFSTQSTELFDKYYTWRNKHFLHDENSMTEAISFLLILPEGNDDIFGGPPSVVWNSVPIDYIQEGIQLKCLLQEILKYVESQIDKLGNSIEGDYCDYTRDELLAFGDPPFKLASTQAPGKNR